jgi:hypothetical protein
VGTGDDDVAWDAVAFVPGDFGGVPEVDFDADNPNAPDVDFLARQVPQDAPSPGAASPLARLKEADKGTGGCSTNSDGTRLCGTYEPLNGRGVPSTSTRGSLEAQPMAVDPGPVSWCKDVSGSDYQYTRFEGCLRGAFVLEADKDGAPIGGATMKIIQELKLNDKSGTFTTWTEVSLISMQGIPSTALSSFIEDCQSQSQCQANPGPWIGSAVWTPGDPHTATRTSTYTWNTVAGGASTLSLNWYTAWSTPGASINADENWQDSGFDVRCDNQVNNNTGCAFSHVTPTLFLNTQKYPAAAAYYWVLMQKLPSHPGAEGHPLTRLADETVAQSNRDKMCVKAVAEWQPNPNAIGTSCDEYPFAKSQQSGGMTLPSGKYCVQMYAMANPGGGYSLKLDENYPLPNWNEICGRAAITTAQNTAAGGDLGRFTQDMRLLDKDAYYVKTGFEGCNLSDVCDLR